MPHFVPTPPLFSRKYAPIPQRISEEGEKQRRHFFSALRSKVLTAGKEIDMLLKG